MGRFASTVEFYSRYREPYPPSFFKKAAEQLALRGNEALLDIGCGPGLLAIGFAPFVGRSTGLDPEPAMLAAAREAAAEAGVTLSFVPGRFEQFSTADKFDLVTIGRALHFLDREAALPVLERIVSDSGHILICEATSGKSPVAPWVTPYDEVRRSWVAETDVKRDRGLAKNWFAESCFVEGDTISVTERRQVTVAELIGRALSKSTTSPEKLGDRRAQFEAELTAVLAPFAQRGALEEEIVARAMVFRRTTGQSS